MYMIPYKILFHFPVVIKHSIILKPSTDNEQPPEVQPEHLPRFNIAKIYGEQIREASNCWIGTEKLSIPSLLRRGLWGGRLFYSYLSASIG
jgi:hypothetical protein